jgi:hypothetical protein
MAEPLSVAVVQTGNYLGHGAEYVHKLRRALRRHLTAPHEFYVVTDDAASLYRGMKVKPSSLPGWWEKLRLFKPGMFPEGRVLFLDLDTFIVGNIDDIAAYDGPFATLRDFWRKDGLGPAVMLWRTDAALGIWEEFVSEGMRMTHPQGDQGFLENLDQGRFRRRIDLLQDLFPGRFVSYKTHCANGVPEGASVVCFHGKPRPHEAGGWASEVWHG